MKIIILIHLILITLTSLSQKPNIPYGKWSFGPSKVTIKKSGKYKSYTEVNHIMDEYDTLCEMRTEKGSYTINEDGTLTLNPKGEVLYEYRINSVKTCANPIVKYEYGIFGIRDFKESFKLSKIIVNDNHITYKIVNCNSEFDELILFKE